MTIENRFVEKSKREAALRAAREKVAGFYTTEEKDGKEIRVGVDEAMKEPLSFLIASEINTDSSCWGHFKDDGAHVNPNLMPEVVICGRLPDREYTDAEVEAAVLDADEYEAKLNDWLAKFYQNRPVADERARIMVDRHEGMPSFSLRSAKDNEIESLPDAEKQEVIDSAHREWTDFTAFLRQQYFEE